MANNYTNATISPFLPATAFTTEETESLSEACGLTYDEVDGQFYFVAEEWFVEEGEDAEGKSVSCVKLLQEKLKGLDPVEYPSIIIEGACYCGKMRPGEFGGFAYLITRDEIRYVSTWQWLHEQETTRKKGA